MISTWFFMGFLVAQAQPLPLPKRGDLEPLTVEDCAKLPLVKRDVLPIANRDLTVTYPDESKMGYLLRGKCSSLIFYEKSSLKQRLKEQGATTIVSDVRNLHQLRSILLHPAYRDTPEIDPESLHVLRHTERLLKKILSSPIKDEQGRVVFTEEERKQLLLSPAQIAETLPSKAFAEADDLQEEILGKADRRNSGIESSTPKPTAAAGDEVKPAPKTVEVAPPPAPAPTSTSAPASVPVPGLSTATSTGAPMTVSPKGTKVEGVIVGTYPGHTPDGKSCIVLIREKGQWYGQRVPMFKAQIIVGDMKPGSRVQDDEFAEVSFNQQSTGPMAPGASIKARTTVGQLLRGQGRLLPDPVVRKKTLDGENLNAVIESFAYKYERAGDRRVNENGELVRNIGTRGEAAVRLVRQKTAIDAKTRDGMLSELTLTTYSSSVGQDISAGSYEAWRKSENAAERAEFDRPKSITCLIDKVQTPEAVPANPSEH